MKSSQSTLLVLAIFLGFCSRNQAMAGFQSVPNAKPFKIVTIKCEIVSVEPNKLQEKLKEATTKTFDLLLTNLGFTCVPLSKSRIADAQLSIKLTYRFAKGSSPSGVLKFSADCEFGESSTNKLLWSRTFDYTAGIQVGKPTVVAGSQVSYLVERVARPTGEMIRIKYNDSDTYIFTKATNVQHELMEQILTKLLLEFRQTFSDDLRIPGQNFGQYHRRIEYELFKVAISAALGEKRWEADSYEKIGDTYKTGLKNFDKALYYYQSALRIYDKIKDEKKQEQMHFSIGNLYYNARNYMKAIEYYKNALNVAQETDYTYAIFDNLHYLGDAYANLGQDSLASAYYNKASKFGEESEELSKNKDKLVKLYRSIGDFHRDLFHHRQALEFYEKALTIYKEKGNEKDEASIYNKIGIVYLNKRTYDDVEIGLSYFKKALETDGSVENSQTRSYIRNIGATYGGLEKFTQAISYYKMLLELEKKYGDKEEIADILVDLGVHYKLSGNNLQARECYLQAQSIYQEIGKSQKLKSIQDKLKELKK